MHISGIFLIIIFMPSEGNSDLDHHNRYCNTSMGYGLNRLIDKLKMASPQRKLGHVHSLQVQSDN